VGMLPIQQCVHMTNQLSKTKEAKKMQFEKINKNNKDRFEIVANKED
jgi:hypothetical protein